MDKNSPASDPRERLRDTIRALERNQFSPSKPNAATDESIPWGLAFHVAVQKEAARIPFSPAATASKHVPGKHPGPASLIKHRVRPAGGSDGKPTQGLFNTDPFSRVSPHLTNPAELSWRSAVSQHVPAGVAAEVSSVSMQQHTQPLPQVSAPGATTASTAAAVNTGVISDAMPRQQSAPPPVGWGPNASRLAEVPETFWRTVAPDVHQEMREYLFDQDYDQGSQLRAMLDALHRQRGQPWGALPFVPPEAVGGKDKQEVREKLASMAATMAEHVGVIATTHRGNGASARSKWFHADGSWEWRPCTVVRASDDCSQFIIRWDHSGGVKTVSRFNILFQGETEQALQQLRDTAIAHQRRLRELKDHQSRMDGMPLSDAPVLPRPVQQRIMARVGGETPESVAVPAGHAQAASSATASVLQSMSQTTSTSPRVRFTPVGEAHQAQGEGAAAASASSPAFNRVSSSAPSSREAGPSATDVLMQLSKTVQELQRGHGPAGQARSQSAVARASVTASVEGSQRGTRTVRSARESISIGSPKRTGKRRAEAMAPDDDEDALPHLSKRFTGWRVDHHDAWRKFQYLEAEPRLHEALEEVALEYMVLHNKMAYQLQFLRETGLQVPQNLDELVDELEHEEERRAIIAARSGGKSQSGAKYVGPHSPTVSPRKPAPARGTVQVVPAAPPPAFNAFRARSPDVAAAEVDGDQGHADGAPVPDPNGEFPLEDLAPELSARDLNEDPSAAESLMRSVRSSSRGGAQPSVAQQELAPLAASAPATPLSMGGSFAGSRPASGRTGTSFLGSYAGGFGAEALAFYSPAVFHERLAIFKANALCADAHLLRAWQQSHHYLFDVQTRDVFGLHELPLRDMFRELSDKAEVMRWHRYMDSRRKADGPLAKVTPLDNSVHLVAFLNVQEGARDREVSDMRTRVCQQLANIVMDSAQEAFEASTAGWDATPSPTPQMLMYGNFSYNKDVHSSHSRPNFDQDQYYRLASLLNVALHNTLSDWLAENIEAYVTAVTMYASPRFAGAPLFEVVLDAVGEEIRYLPTLDTLTKRLTESVQAAVKDVNHLPGLQVVPKPSKGAVTMPFDVLPDLEMPTIIALDDPLVKQAVKRIEEAAAACKDRCELLLSDFSKHLNLLHMDSKVLKQQLTSTRSAMSQDQWSEAVRRYRDQWYDIVENLPIEAHLGLFHVDCRALQRRLADQAEKLALTVLLTVQEDAADTSAKIIAKLKPVLETLTQPLADLHSVYKVREMTAQAPEMVFELWGLGVELKMDRDIMDSFKHKMPDELSGQVWEALRLPVLVTEAVAACTASMPSTEEFFLSKLKRDREQFAVEIQDAGKIIGEWSLRFSEELAEEYVLQAREQLHKVRGMLEHAEAINKQEALAGWQVTSYSVIHQLRRQLVPYHELWKLVKAFKEKYQIWMYGPLFSFDMEEMETSVPAWLKMAARLAKDLKGPPQSVASKYSTYLMDFESHMPLIRALRTQGLRQRHWNRIHADVPHLAELDKSQLTLHTMLQSGMHRHVGVLRELADLAARELVIEQAVDAIEAQFMELVIAFMPDTDSGIPDMHSLTNGNDLIKFVDDAQLRIKGLSTSVYVDPHKESVIQWDEALSSVRAVLEGWLEVQAKWSHLAPLFGPSGLAMQLPLEARRFADVTREWRKTINKARSHCRPSELLRHSELHTLLADLSRGLEGVHKGVMEFLEEKRSNFPRFYFLSNNEMVNVLVRSHDPTAIEPYLGRCFPGIKHLHLSREWGIRIEGLISPEGEQLLLRNPVDLVDYNTQKGVDVEVWMMSLEKQMRIAMRETLRACMESLVTQQYDQWLLNWPAQSVLLTGALVWCRDVTEAYKRGPPMSGPLQRLDQGVQDQIMKVVGIIQQQKLTQLQRSVLENVIIAKVYHKDVTSRLRSERVESVDDIEWLRVMRFYLEGETVIRCGYSQISYGQEYLGNSPRLVITPLTERAFSSLITAVHLHFGGAPEGPAGTGKTETVKELARCVAKQCIVFNTTEQLDVHHMTRLLMGITSTGAWSCFDEFNRMDMEVLSVVAKQIMTIQAALAAGERYFVFEGRNLGVNSSLAMFITMNPMYEFRSVLPSNLKALFRPVAMMVPDYKMIAEVSLYANGFQTAGSLATNLVSCLKIASHRLSNQAHYDFGMRTLKSVLLIAAQLRTEEAGMKLNASKEASLCRVALLRCNMSKLKARDAQIFLSVVDREFPEPGTAESYMEALKQHLREACKALKMHPTEELLSRCLQTYSMLQIRTGVMILGPAACGKTSTLAALRGALSRQDAENGLPPVMYTHMFPKAVQPSRLYGQYNSATQTWEDGVLTANLRQALEPSFKGRAWIVLDGPVDHVWVEALNPVLDDNRTLCLSSGETIPLRDGVNLVMEVDSIAMASPATVSRCGMVYMDKPTDLWRHIVRGWLANIGQPLGDYHNKLEVTINTLFNELIKAYQDAMEPDATLPRQQPTSVLMSLLRLLDSMLPIVTSKIHQGMEEKDVHGCIESAILFCMVWAFEASLPSKTRAFFNILVRQMCARTLKYKTHVMGEEKEHSTMGFHIPMPPDGSVWDFMFDFDELKWVSWKEHVEALLDTHRVAAMGPTAFVPFGLGNLIGGGGPAVRDFVFTADNLPSLYIMRLLVASRTNVLLMGPTGTGKTVMTQALLASAEEWMAAINLDDTDTGGDYDGGRPGSMRRNGPLSQGSSANDAGGRPMSGMSGIAGSVMGDDTQRRQSNPFASMYISLSSQSTASNTKRIIESYLVKRRKTVMGPPVGRLAVMFVDDVSSAGRDVFGTQGALELLRQWCSTGGWHDELLTLFKQIVDTQLVGCMTVAPLQKPVSDRLLQYVNLVAMPPISHAGFQLIFTSVLKRYMNNMTTIAGDLLPALVSGTMDLYRSVTATLLPVPSRPHYLFSIRHVGAVFKAMFNAHRSSRSTPNQLVRLWQHECARVFQDCIVDTQTREWFNDTLFKISSEHLQGYCPQNRPDGRDVVFCTFASHGGNYYELAEFVLRGDRTLTPESYATLSGGPSAAGTPREGVPRPPSNISLPSTPGESAPSTPQWPGARSAAPGTPQGGSDVQRLTTPGELRSQGHSQLQNILKLQLPGEERATPNGTSGPGTPLKTPDSTSMTPITPLPPPPESALMKLYSMPWMDDGSGKEEAVQARLTAICAQHAEEYFASQAVGDGRDVVIFRTALMHISRISRVMCMEQGHMILAGQPGSGRRTLARLAAHLSKIQLFEANLKDTQKGFNWKDTLKHVMHTAGVLGRPTCLLLVDIGHTASMMMDDVTHLMSTSHLPGLYKVEEMQTIIKSLKPVARAAGIQWSEIDRTGAADHVLHQFFIDRCRSNLHVLLIIEYQEQALQHKIVQFPKMFHLAAMNLVDDWDHDARSEVAKRVLISPETLHLDNLVYQETVTTCVEFHDVAKRVSVDYNLKAGGQSVFFVTACQYLQLLHHIREQLPRKRSLLSDDKDKYLEGVAKMTEMTARLKRLQDEIAAMQPKLQERQVEASQLMAMIQEEKSEAESALAAILPEEEQAQAAAEKKAELVNDCEAELNKVMPPLRKALKELGAIDKASIAELKVMKNPPSGVKLVMRCICIMFDMLPDMVLEGKIKDDEAIVKAWWDQSIRVLSDFKFLENLLTYDKDSMTQDMVDQVQMFVCDPNFDPFVVARSSQPAAVICKWVIAMDNYQKVKKVVDPKRAALREAENEMRLQELRLKEARQRLATVNEKIKELEVKYGEATAAKERLQDDIEAAQRKVAQAQKVLNTVRKEVERWKKNAEESDIKHKQVLGEALLSSGYIAYLGPVPGSFRLQCESGWAAVLERHDIPAVPHFQLVESLGETAQLEAWRDALLPQSKTAVENALVMSFSQQWALLVDPQELGNQFLRAYYGGEGRDMNSSSAASAINPLKRGQVFMKVDQSDPSFKESILRAIETGAVLLLENLDENMDDMIEQVLQQNTFHNQKGELCIKLGDASVLYNQSFKMFVTTRQRNPKFPFIVLRHMCVVNFSITRAQLGELLITTTLKHEMPELEQEHGLLIKQKAKNALEIAALEEQVLQAINVTSTEALLGESDVYNMLVALQDSASSIKAKILRIDESQRRINDVRGSIDKFFVSRVVVFFFVLMDLSNVRHIYQFSLKWFIALFKDALQTCPRSNTGRERLESLTLHFAVLLYTNVSRSLFDEDKLPFSVLMLARYMLASSMCTKEETNLLLFGRLSDGKPSLARLADGGRRTTNMSHQVGGTANAGAASFAPPPPKAQPAPSKDSNTAPAATGSAAPAAAAADPKAAGGGGAFDGLFRGGSGGNRQRQRGGRQPGGAAALPSEISSAMAPVDDGQEQEGLGGSQNREGQQPGGGAAGIAPKQQPGSTASEEQVKKDIEERKKQDRHMQLATARDEEVDELIGSSNKGKAAPVNNMGLPSTHTIQDFLEMSAPAQLPDESRPEWLPEEAWLRLKDLGKVYPYNKILPVVFPPEEDLDLKERMHSYFVELAEGGVEGVTDLPHQRIRELSPFQRLLFIRCFQPRAFMSAAKEAVRTYLGPACTITEPIDFEGAFSMTSASMPIVLISSTDQPLPQLLQFAEGRGVKVLHMAIGRGQGGAADKVIRSSVSQALWVVLENTHLAGDWMPQLCSLVQALPAMRPHWDFRLWLTTVPSEDFPAVILQTALKLVMDPPTGIKANLIQVMGQLPSDIANSSKIVKSDAPVALPSFPMAPKKGGKEILAPKEPRVLSLPWRQLVLRLCLFHALLLERRHYKALGWRRPYDFSAADFLSTIKQIMQVHTEEQEIDRALPGLLYVDGQCLYGGKCTHDWDRRLLTCLLQQQMMPAGATAPTVDTLLPEKLSSCTMDLAQIMREVRYVTIDADDPNHVGLTSGASVVRQSQQTRHVLNMLKRVQLMQTTDEHDASKPLQLALTVSQEVSRQLPFTVLPAVHSGWVAMVHDMLGGSVRGGPPPAAAGRPPGSPRGTPAAGAAGTGPGGAAGTAAPPAAGTSPVAGLSSGVNSAVAEKLAQRRPQLKVQVSSKNPGGAPPAPKPVNRARQLKMTETMSAPAVDRWNSLPAFEKRMMVQLFEAEVTNYQAVLGTVHATVKLVSSAIKGFEPVTGEFQELVRQLANNEVPHQWLVHQLELNSETISTWIQDLLDRLEFVYRWAVEGPPVVFPMGMLSKPKAFLTVIQQIHAEKLDRPVGSLVFDCQILQEGEEMVGEMERSTAAELKKVMLHTAEGGTVSVMEASQRGCLISGVLMQGAAWDRSNFFLQEAGASQIYCAMPLLWLLPRHIPTQQHAGAPGGSDARGGGSPPPRLSMAGGGTISEDGRGVMAYDGGGGEDDWGGAERYLCPVYMHAFHFDSRINSQDVDDCLFDVLLPCGDKRPSHWVTRNVVLLVTSDPEQLVSMQNER